MDVSATPLTHQFWQKFRQEFTAIIQAEVPAIVRNELHNSSDIKELKADVASIKETVGDHTATLENHTAILEDHSTTLKHHTTMLKDLSAILKSHTATLEDHTAILYRHSASFKTLQADMSTIKNTVRGNSKEIHKLGVLLEDLDYRFTAAGEAN